MKNWFFPFLMILILLTPTTVGAQNTITFDSIVIEMWPEYDSPEMLVIYRIDLSPDVSLPAEINIRIPAAAGEPNAVAVRELNNDLLLAPYIRKVQGDWALITITATMPGIQIEYYDPQLTKNGSLREFEYTWLGEYSTESLIVQLQQPLDATQFITSPSPVDISPNIDGMNYHTIDLGAQPTGASLNVSVNYSKDSDSLSVEGLQVQPSVPISTSTSGRENISKWLPWGLGALGLMLLIGGVWWYWRLSRQEPQTKKRGRSKRSSRTPKYASDKGGSNDQAIYCQQCGKRARSGDRFCRSCGTKLKTM
jgi:hypothetical protein